MRRFFVGLEKNEMYDKSVREYTLMKLLRFVKFDCSDFESREFAGSPIIGEIYLELINSFNSRGIDIPLELNETHRNYIPVTEGVKRHLQQTHEWENMAEEDRISHIINLASPFILSEHDLQALYKFKEDL